MKTVLKLLLWVLIAVTVGLVGWAVYSGGAEAIISYNLMWGYGLLAFAVVGVICAALVDTLTHPAGLMKTLITIVIVGAVVGGVIALVKSHELTPVANSAGGVFDDKFELTMVEAGIYVTYIVAAIAVVVVAFDLLKALIRKVIK